MGRTLSIISAYYALLWFILGFYNLSRVYGNAEGDALNAFKTQLNDPNNVLQGWNATEVNPCKWVHVTCDGVNTVTRVDLGNADLSGQLVPQLGQLTNLQYLELYNNSITGIIPSELGNLTNLVSLDLYVNRLEGEIPNTLGNLQKLRFLRLNNNTLTGSIPTSLTTIDSLQVIDLSSNRLSGVVPSNGSFSLFKSISFLNNPNLTAAAVVPPALRKPQSASVARAAALAGGVSAALLFGALAWWCRKKWQDYFFHVPDTRVALDWPKRKRIALGSARGLAYLHDICNPKIIHRNVKAANILLDHEFEAVVGYFGLVKLMDHKDTQVTTVVHCTLGHIAPEYFSTGICSEKTDVYGYGVMLLELITGKRTIDLARIADNYELMFLDWANGLLRDKQFEKVVDVDLEGNYVDDEVELLLQVARLCTQSRAFERPKMSEVVTMLEGEVLAERWKEWQKEEILRQDFNQTHNPNIDWIMKDSNYKVSNDQLSGPR